MRRIILLATITSLAWGQDVEDGEIEDTSPAVVVENPTNNYPEEPTKKNSTDRRNWIFAAGSMVAATIAIIIVSLNPGDGPPGQSSQ